MESSSGAAATFGKQRRLIIQGFLRGLLSWCQCKFSIYTIGFYIRKRGAPALTIKYREIYSGVNKRNGEGKFSYQWGGGGGDGDVFA
jgi:hypothetical protein